MKHNNKHPAPEVTRAYNERMVNFMENLQEKKAKAKVAYIKARNEWANTRTAKNMKGDFEKWKILCDRKIDCMRLGVII